MNVTGLETLLQWDEVQRAVREKSIQRQNPHMQKNTAFQTAAGSVVRELGDDSSQQSTVFTKSGQLQKVFFAKGTIFDKVG